MRRVFPVGWTNEKTEPGQLEYSFDRTEGHSSPRHDIDPLCRGPPLKEVKRLPLI